jgi:predicted RNase H-like HicB family nuclease/uncharacterized damage-inducible protein DinB
MAHYAAYLEIADDGRCLAHVLDLPGLVVRAQTAKEALGLLPKAIDEYHAWLQQHGEPVTLSTGAIEIDVAGESVGFGPFERRSAAALFPPDKEAVAPEEMERTFRLMAHSRADLLALVRDLPDRVLDWKPDAKALSIRGLLRHVGNAEEWYVSRLVPPETLPPEWADDEDVPIFEFLEMERASAVERLRQLTEGERSNIFYPTGWTDHPREPWTARKVLRRFLEHEREHTWQVREILDAQRHHLLARLASERAGLLEQLVGLDERALTEVPVVDDWTIKDLLAHIAAWDRWEERSMRAMVAGKEPDLRALHNLDATNVAFVAEWHERNLGKVVGELLAARAGWEAWLLDLPLEEFFRPRQHEGEDWSFYSSPLPVQWRHDAEHAKQIAAWRHAEEPKGEVGPKIVLLAALDAARQELLAAAALVPAGERASRPICGDWTLKHLLGHVADWEWLGAEGLRHMAAGKPPEVEHIEDLDAWNQTHAEARRDEPWGAVWKDLHEARQELLDVLEAVDESGMDQRFPFPWGVEGTPYGWLTVYLAHDREHAQDLRSGLERVDELSSS